ncbi:hypothetical protein H5T87_02310 [bacterium]|nr:hypothetical protein [bacterium]
MKVERFLLGIILLLFGAISFAEEGLPQFIFDELAPNQAIPAGKYLLIRSLEAESDFSHNGGMAVSDEEASKGKAWEANPLNSNTGQQVVFGPYLELTPGDYVAFYRLKVLEDADDEVVATIDVCVDYARTILNSKLIYGSDIPINRYRFFSLPFSYKGGKLEWRVSWNGSAPLRVDRIDIYKVEGGNPSDFQRKLAPQPVPSGEPRNLVFIPKHSPFPQLFPRSAQPDETLIVCDASRLSSDWQLALVTLQGIVNREKPKIYLLLNPTDEQWLEWMIKRGWIKGKEGVDDPKELLNRFAERIKGMIITDPRLPATKNIATMLASLEDAVVVSPRLSKELNLPIVEDLRGHWKTNVSAYRWALDNLWDKMNHQVLACLYPDHLWLRDYLVENKVFIFWISGRIDGAEPYANTEEEVRFAENLLAKAPPNIPIMGYPWAGVDVGMGEGPGVTLFSEFAKFLVGSINCSNLSVHSGIPDQKFAQQVPPPVPQLQRDKVYVSFIISDGDNLPVLTVGNFPQLWQDKMRGQFPIGWTISPSAHILIPAVVDYYYSTATPNDSFLAAVSGVGYCYPDSYATRYRERAKVYDEFLDITAEHMNKMGLDMAWIMGVTRPELISRYAERIPNLKAIFPDYGRRLSEYSEAVYMTAKNVPVFHAVTSWRENATREEQIANIVAQVRSITPPERPAFLHIFICNWFFDLPMLEEILKQLGPEYVAVRPDHLASLYKRYCEEEKLLIRAPSTLVAIEGQPLLFSVVFQNVSQSALSGEISVEGLKNLRISKTRFSLSAAQSQTVEIQGTPVGENLKLVVKGKDVSIEEKFPIQLIKASEIATPLAHGATLKFVRHLEAEDLAHNSGRKESDPEASNGAVWAAKPGDAGGIYIVFGPYMPLNKGRYLALYRLKRTGEGQGEVVTLDTCVGGGNPVTSSSVLSVDKLPLNQFRRFGLTFEHPGGAVETRVFWNGKVAVAVDCIDLWQIVSK